MDKTAPKSVVVADEEKSLSWLTPRERHAYEYFLGRRAQGKTDSAATPLSPDVVAKMFGLYLRGLSIADIHAQNEQFGLGQIVHAAVSHNWNEMRIDTTQDMMRRVQEQVMHAQAESVGFVSELLSAANKLHQKKIRAFLQSGNLEDAGSILPTSIKQYKDIVELLLRLTGQNNNSTTLGGTVEHKHTHSYLPTTPLPEAPQEDASNLLAAWAEEETKKSGK